ncbi:MAG: hypothetical protein VX796_16695 [Pseudomonadota bacterium]|nr:hypothetical protein [Pseudomonadota bacterium]
MADTIDIQNTNEWLAEVQAAARDLVNVLKGGIDVGQSGTLGDLALLDNATQIPQFAAAVIAEMAKYGFAGTANSSVEDSTKLTEIVNSIVGFNPSYAEFAGAFLTAKWTGNQGWQGGVVVAGGGKPRDAFYHRAYNTGTNDWGDWRRHLDSSNTTVDSNGFIKQASPIFRLANVAEDASGDGFTLDGCGAYNSEAEGVTASHDDVGVYTVSGSLGFADEGWAIEIPQDVNGNRLCFVETETADDGTITVRTFGRRFDYETAMIVAGDPIDIPDGRWIDLRLAMPEPEQPGDDDAAEQEPAQ